MKGKVKIELFEEGKKVREIEHSNTFQSGIIQKWFETMGANNRSPYNFTDKATVEAWKHLVGGLLLLDDSNGLINVGDYCVAEGVEMTGNGSYKVSNSGAPNELGSYNQSEEIVGANALTLVWDFTTAQANGKITTVCLTSDWGGYIGLGNKSGRMTPIDFVRQQNAAVYEELSREYQAYASNGRMYAFAINGANLTLYERNPSFDSYDLIDSNPAINSVEVTEYNLTITPFTATRYMVGMVDGQYLVIVGAPSSVAANGTFTVLVVDCLTQTVTQHTVTNTTGLTITCAAGSGSFVNMNAYGIIDEDTILLHAQDGADIKSFKIDVSTSVATNLGVITDGATLQTISNSDGAGYSHSIPLPGGKVIIGSLMFDGTLGTLSLINANSTDTGAEMALKNCYNDRMLVSWRSYGARTMMIHNPLMLHTIAVLDNAVTKSNTQSMKVTYTLTRA